MARRPSIFDNEIDPMTGFPIVGGQEQDPYSVEPPEAPEPMDFNELGPPQDAVDPEAQPESSSQPDALTMFAQANMAENAQPAPGEEGPDEQEMMLQQQADESDVEAERSMKSATKAKGIGSIVSGFLGGAEPLDTRALDEKVAGKQGMAEKRRAALDKYRKVKGEREERDYGRERDRKGDEERAQSRSDALRQREEDRAWQRERAAKEDAERDEGQATDQKRHEESMATQRAQLRAQREATAAAMQAKMEEKEAARTAAEKQAIQAQIDQYQKEYEKVRDIEKELVELTPYVQPGKNIPGAGPFGSKNPDFLRNDAQHDAPMRMERTAMKVARIDSGADTPDKEIIRAAKSTGLMPDSDEDKIRTGHERELAKFRERRARLEQAMGPAALEELNRRGGATGDQSATTGPGAQAPATVGDPNEDAAALAWARANPNDPRAKQILMMHGGQ